MFEQSYYNGNMLKNVIQQQQPNIANFAMPNVTNQRMQRSVSNQNVNSDRSAECMNKVEYEVSMPVPIIRHGPYHSLWNLHQW